jgi:hypothetical protein
MIIRNKELIINVLDDTGRVSGDIRNVSVRENYQEVIN